MIGIKDAYPFLTNLLGEDADQVLHIVKITIEGLERDLLELAEAISLKDRVFARNTLHRMRSSLGHMAMNDVLTVMPRSRDEDLWERIPTFIIALKEELARQKKIIIQVEKTLL
ncbi:hypothetical protein SAMN05421640_1081 [Ekhidna lutea]|uniref:HPt domain-containing protein n=1 Tax=Ekhidna lutea TaxID=447679 RepID=A0A239GZQ3_EKHLU|nr:hypothetical protein [Ekhidna lutea]SNS74620.1 hypothetical protein SAMN05421640_1081 [Ekhidna lutea]